MFWLLKPYISEIVLKQRDQLPKIKFFILDKFYKVDDRIEKKDVLEKKPKQSFFFKQNTHNVVKFANKSIFFLLI